MTSLTSRTLKIIVIEASLGYFVDIYDLTLFLIVRKDSLLAIGVTGDNLLTEGIYLLNMQVLGMVTASYRDFARRRSTSVAGALIRPCWPTPAGKVCAIIRSIFHRPPWHLQLLISQRPTPMECAPCAISLSR